jgi:hypothetical protein
MINYRVTLVFALLFLGLLSSCDNKQQENKDQSKKSEAALEEFSFEIQEFSDKDYPDNPNIGYRSNHFSSDYFKDGKLETKEGYKVDLTFYSSDKYADSITLNNFNLSELIPTVPTHLCGKDEYLTKITLINQEWNRNQVKLVKNEFKSTNDQIVRLDISRNCLNAYLWEIIAYTNENGKELPLYHGWFNFPKKAYKAFFESKNDLNYSEYSKSLEKWNDPENKTFDKGLLRSIEDTIQIKYSDKSDRMYPLKGARLKKYKEVITPDTFSTMKDLQSDSTTFATFSQPGYYNKENPRHTELGRFYHLDDIELYDTKCNEQNKLSEIKFSFLDRQKQRKTYLYFGGINLENLPKLSADKANEGWKNSMGFGNHPFYEDYNQHLSWKLSESCYYGYLTNEKDEWIDSHHVGIDGPILHWDDQVENRLHVWLLSFERHALVGHYVIDVIK